MSKEQIYADARKEFDRICSFPDDGHHFRANLQLHQVKLAAWVNTVLHQKTGRDTNVLGIGEEIGEMAEGILELLSGMTSRAGIIQHALLKHKQGIREYAGQDEQKLRAVVADAIADMTVFAIQLCTDLRLDFHTLLTETIGEVTQRDWQKDPKGIEANARESS